MKAQRMLPLYEAKMIHHYDHRWATNEPDGSIRDVTLGEKQDPAFASLPRYWVREELVEDRLANRWDRDWILGWRNITNATNERTTVVAIFPVTGVGHSLPLAVPGRVVLLAALTTAVSDYVARQKVAGTNFTFSYFQQIPALAPNASIEASPWSSVRLGDWVRDRIRELVYTAYDMRAFAEDLGDNGEPFVWDVERRFWLRAELDAAFFHLYGVERDDVDYIMETFPIVKRKDIAARGRYRTKDAILQIYDTMQVAIDGGERFVTVLDPPPGEGPRHPAQEERHD